MSGAKEHTNVEESPVRLRSTKQRFLYIGGGALFVTGLIVAGALGLLSGLGAPASDADLAADVMRSVSSDVTAAVPDQYGTDFGDDILSAFPEGTDVNPLVDTWVSDGVAGGSMQVELTLDAEVTVLNAVFAQHNDSWVLITMEETE